MWWNYYPSMPWFGIVCMVFCGAMMFMMMRGMMGHGRSAPSDDRFDLQILKERYARGEISKTEYEERRHILQG